MFKFLSVLLIVLSACCINAQTYCFQSEDDVMTYVIGKTFESKDGQVSIKFNSSEAILQAGENNLSYMYEQFNYMGAGYKGLVTLTELGGSGGLKLYVSCKEKMMTDNAGTLLYEKTEGNQKSGAYKQIELSIEASRYSGGTGSKQIWMSEYLNTEKFQNGDMIFHAKDWLEWSQALEEKKPAWSYYDFDESNSACGKFYNYYTIIDTRVLAPRGWKIPTSQNVKDIQSYRDEPNLNAQKLKSQPCGFNNSMGGEGKDKCEVWWTLDGAQGFLEVYNSWLSVSEKSKNYGFQVRCIKQ